MRGVVAAAAVTATKLLVNLSEPSQVARAAWLNVEGVGLLRAELMIVEALAGMHPRTLIDQGRQDEFVERMAAGLTTFAEGFVSVSLDVVDRTRATIAAAESRVLLDAARETLDTHEDRR
jgi:phosphoenolpyruvate synthase/pyruvate phosphate dikinase